MVKKKGGREMNPADAFRKAQRAKEISRNKKERQLQREAFSKRDDPESLKEQLKEIIEMEQAGKMNPTLRLRKKALQSAYDQAIKRKMEGEAKDMDDEAAEVQRRPEDSVYFHPTLNPLGIPPPGKPQRYKEAAAASSQQALPVPKPPPLPAGPAPHLPPPPRPPPMPAGAPPGSAPLPPPPGPPPGSAALLPPPPGFTLPPPPGRPPGFAQPLSPPSGPPPSLPSAGQSVLPPPQGPPPMMPPHYAVPLPPPPMPPPYMGMLPPNYAPPPVMEQAAAANKPAVMAAGGATISAKSTVVSLPRAQNDKRVTSMVPASLLVRRDAAPRPAAARKVDTGPGFGLVPRSVAAAAPALRRPVVQEGVTTMDKKYQEFLDSMNQLGAL